MSPTRPYTALLLAAAIIAVPARADNLAAALEAAYEQNPDIAAQRALVRQSDEEIPQALAPARPQVGAQLTADQAALDAFTDNGRTYRAGLSLSQSLYRGGRTRSATTAAENRVLAARARLRATENQIVLNTVTAYADVLRFARVVELNRSQVNVLDRELQQSRDRFEVGDLTRTDVAQSQARLANAQSNLVVAENQYAAARQAYLRVVGRLPQDLEPLPPLPILPGNAGEAVDLARENAPNLLAARFDEAAARYDVTNLQQQRLPTVDMQLSGAYSRFEGGGGGANFVRQGSFITQDALVTATVPIWQRGLVGSQVRQAQQRRSQLAALITSTDRQTEESVVNSFNQLRAARAVIEANKVAADANALAAEGVKQENQVGTRTIIEVLNAEQERLNSEVNLVTARRDEQVAAYSLLSAVGAAEAVALGVPVERYDPTANTKRVRRLLGEGGDPNVPALPVPVADRATQSLVIGPPKP
ncbi:TolC family outer membrane protein [Polymorphobacter fuscus]|nr:TolC family outer membrane protein [Polymorphobacter fuscus]NJC08140.1 outer membrane protein [Polymorphobacter fuscus]